MGYLIVGDVFMECQQFSLKRNKVFGKIMLAMFT